MTIPTTTSPSVRGGLRYQRIVVKAGTNVLTRKSPRLSRPVMESLAAQIAEVMGMGAQVALVTSGAIAAGREAAPEIEEGESVAVSQMLAAVGQSRLMHAYQELFARRGITVAQALLSGSDVDGRVGYLNIRNTLSGLLDHRIVPIVNENDVVDTAEITDLRFGDNDTLSAAVANIIGADLLLVLTDTGGLFKADPNRDASAELVPRVEEIDASVMALAERHRGGASRGGMASKLAAARRATAVGVTVVFGPGNDAGVVRRAACGEEVGTLFPPSVSWLESRKRWLLSGLTKKGAALVVDEGARRALVEQERSLLPAGVREVRGDFARGDVVEVVSERGELLACGIANYGAPDCRRIAGARSDRFMEMLGHHYGDEAVHRNNLVVL